MNEAGYRYYRLGNLPVRITLTRDGLKQGAEALDPQTGALRLRMDLLSRIETGADAEEIDQAAFDGMCAGLRRA